MYNPPSDASPSSRTPRKVCGADPPRVEMYRMCSEREAVDVGLFELKPELLIELVGGRTSGTTGEHDPLRMARARAFYQFFHERLAQAFAAIRLVDDHMLDLTRNA